MDPRVFVSALLLLVLGLVGCGGHAARTLPVRNALDAGDPRGAIAHINEEIGVKRDTDLPPEIVGDNALLVLDRATVQQSLAQFTPSARDFGAADKAIDMLDLAHNASDSIGKYVFSDSSGRYQAPPYEKLLINTLNMINYLENKDLEGAKVEARRLAVMLRYYKDQLHEGENAILGMGGILSGFTFEKDGQIDEALRYYDDALAFSGRRALAAPVARLLEQGSYVSPRLKEAAAGVPASAKKEGDDGEILIVIGHGRVPHKIPERIPIGLALTLVAGDISPTNEAAANRLAAQGLVTWINYPTLAPERDGGSTPSCMIDGRYAELEQAVDVSREVRREWKKIEGKVILSAITRLVARVALGQGIQAATKQSTVGVLASLATQATLTVLDTPDTRSWETLPARLVVARVRVPAGRHALTLEAHGVSRRTEVVVEKGGWAVVSLMALR